MVDSTDNKVRTRQLICRVILQEMANVWRVMGLPKASSINSHTCSRVLYKEMPHVV